MVLTPQLRQRIEMLQMTSLELEDLIEQEMIANPILEEVQPGEEIQEIGESILDQNSNGVDVDYTGPPDADGGAAADKAERFEAALPEGASLNGSSESAESSADADLDTGDLGAKDSDSDDEGSGDSFDEIDYGREFQDYLDPGYRTQEIEYKEDAPSFEQFLTHSPTLSEHLEWQLSLVSLDEDVDEAAVLVIGNLDGDGRLSSPLEEIAETCQSSEDIVEHARQAVMRLDPVGCGAFTVHECLSVQLEAMGEGDSLAAELVKDHLEDLQPHRLQHLSKRTGVDMHILDREIEKIRQLDPFPGRRYSSEGPVFVSPEVYVEKLEDDYVIYFADDGGPRLRISPTYHKLLDQDETTKETKDFIKEKVRSAVDLLRNIEHRRQTIYRVVECIVQRQRDFLDNGVEHIKPMMLKDIAADIGMHLSTISRVVNRKYAHTPQGVIELRRFFSEGMLNEEGEEVSTRILKLRIKKMVEDEDTKKPLTDDQIARVLSNEGVKLSRRTVAKYRDQMNIPGSRERKTVI